MPSLTLTLKYNIADGLAISPSAILSNYLYGIPLTDQTGKSFSIVNIRNLIVRATTQLENYLQVKITEQTITERRDYIKEEWMNWGHIKLNYRANSLEDSVKGILNTQEVVTFGKDIWTIQGRNLAIVPSANNWSTNVIVGQTGGTFPLLSGGVKIIPDFWKIVYKTGFTVIPEDIISALAKLTSIQILAVLGDILLGAGIASQSISFDGLSESIGTTQSAENSAYSARIKQYAGELKLDLKFLKDHYYGFAFEVL